MLVISNRPRASRSCNFEITRAITPWIVLHSVQLLLLISMIITDTDTFYCQNKWFKAQSLDMLYWYPSIIEAQWLRFTHVQYTQTDTNHQETLTNGTIGKKSPFVKEALRFAPLVRMESSSVHWYTICKLHLITTWEPCVSDLSIGAIGSNRFRWKRS